MIRPITVICWILALGAGLYLYRAKHEVELMDKHIDQIAKQTSDLRAESRRLLDDWIRLGEPEQLHKYSDEYLGLKTIAPTQFARLSDLPNRLPTPRADPADTEPDAVAQSSDPAAGVPVPGASSADGIPSGSSGGVSTAGVQPATTDAGGGDADQVNAAGDDDLPLPPIPPAMVPTEVAVTLPAVTAPPLQARPVTPRPAAAQPELDAARARAIAAARAADEQKAARPAPVMLADPRRTPGQPPAQDETAPGQPAWQAGAVLLSTREELPLQAQGVASQPQGLPPLQAQGLPQLRGPGYSPIRAPAPGQPTAPGFARVSAPESSRAPGQGFRQGQTQDAAQGPTQGYAQVPAQGRSLASGQPVGQPAYPPTAPRVADSRANEPQRDVRPVPPQPMDPRIAGNQNARQSPPPQMTTGSSGGGSLLGAPRGPVPLPLPAPTPVSATWSGPGPAGPSR